MLGSGSHGVGPAAQLNLVRGVLSPWGRARRTDHPRERARYPVTSLIINSRLVAVLASGRQR
eukprot:5301200-Pleurochrysis_carterae.AAC.1